MLTIVRQVADGLRFAHDKRIVHCDLKPANVLISDDGCPQLIDFGIAFDKSNLSIEQFRVGGTRPYMSPEQLTSVASEHMEYDERSDLYGVGVILYELVTGELPFEPNFVSTPAAIENDCMNRFKPPPSPRSLNPKVPLAIESIISKCLAPDVTKRYQNAKELYEDLDRQLARKPLRFAPNPSKRELAVKWSTRNRLFLVAAGFAAVVGIAAAGVAHRDAKRAQWTLDVWNRPSSWSPWQPRSRSPPTFAMRKFYFGLAETDPAYRERAWESARRALSHYGAWHDDLWFTRSGYQELPSERLASYRHQVASLMLLLANSESLKASRMPVGSAQVDVLQLAATWSRRAETTDPDPEGRRAIWLQRAFLARLGGNLVEAEQIRNKALATPRVRRRGSGGPATDEPRGNSSPLSVYSRKRLSRTRETSGPCSFRPPALNGWDKTGKPPRDTTSVCPCSPASWGPTTTAVEFARASGDSKMPKRTSTGHRAEPELGRRVLPPRPNPRSPETVSRRGRGSQPRIRTRIHSDIGLPGSIARLLEVGRQDGCEP